MARLSQTIQAMGKLRRGVPVPGGALLARVAHGIVGGSVLAATIVTFVRCSDMSSGDNSSFEGADDAGNSDSAAVPSTQSEAGAKDASDLPRVLVVAHAAPDTFDFRLCFGISASADGANAQVLPLAPLPDDPKSPMPQANYPGIGRGNGTVVDPELGAIDGQFVVPYLVNAFNLASGNNAQKNCNQLFDCIGSACIKSPQDFVKLPAVEASTFTGGGSRLLAIVGSGSAISLKSIPLDGVGTTMRGQLAHLSSSVGPITARYGSLDGGADSGVLLGSASFGAAGTTAIAITAPAMAAFGSTGITVASADSGAPLLRTSLAEIQQATDPSRAPDESYKNKTSYVFVLLGDPATPRTIDGGPNPEFGARGLHVVALRSSALPGDGGTL